MLKHPYPTYNDMPRNNQEIWFRTFAVMNLLLRTIIFLVIPF